MYKSNEVEFPNIGNGNTVVTAWTISEEDLARDNNGFTNPNLHRRIDSVERETSDPSTPYDMYNDVSQFEFGHRAYKFAISGLWSYRLTEMHNHDEDSTYWEIP